MIFSGWVRTSLADARGHVAAVLFTAGCNYRCPFCHNPALVHAGAGLPVIREEEIFTYLAQRKGLVDAVVVSGGEPTLQTDLLPFLRRLRAFDHYVKLDSNGSRPDMLEVVLGEGLVDAVAMDIKAAPANYARLAGVPAHLEAVRCSVRLLNAARVDVEFRTTVLRGIHTVEEMTTIAQAFQPARRYVLQPFRAGETLADDWGAEAVPDRELLEKLADAVRACLPGVEVR